MSGKTEKYVKLTHLSGHGEVDSDISSIDDRQTLNPSSTILSNHDVSSQEAANSNIDHWDGYKTRIFLFFKDNATIIIIIIVIILFLTLVQVKNNNNDADHIIYNSSTIIHKLGFGSCTSYDMREMTIWRDAIIPAEIDAWIWAGDMVYVDSSDVNCQAYADSYAVADSNIWQSSCNCTPSWLDVPPYSCRAGDVDYAQERWTAGLSDIYYNQFLEYMCPIAMSQGIFPPPGLDSLLCDHPIFGIYDDHDYGGDNMNDRLPHKAQYKAMYLDAIGEDRDSIRRNDDRGAWMKYTINDQASVDDHVDIFMLDERYERESLPCDTMRDSCERMILPDTTGQYSRLKPWCDDFLYGSSSQPHMNDDSKRYRGTCCSLDEDIYYGWCQHNSSYDHIYYQEACNISYDGFGQRSLVYDPVADDLRLPDGSEPMDVYKHAPFCDVLGYEQRRWLRKSLLSSTAAVKVIVSGSVLLNNPTPFICGNTSSSSTSLTNTSSSSDDITCRCSGDDWDCYSVAQRELIRLLSRASGCVIIITGDFHYSDIKAMMPGYDHAYATDSIYASASNRRPIYQVMASGMSYSTATNVSCAGYRLDPLGLRIHPECSFVTGPNFGMLEFEYNEDNDVLETIMLQIRGGTTADDVKLQSRIDAKTCMMI